MGRHCKRSKQWGKLIFILLYMHGDLHSCLIPSTSASSLLVLEKKGWSWEGGCRSEIWHLHTILHLEFHWCAAKVILALWRCMVNRFPTNVKARAFFFKQWEVEDFGATGLDFQQIPYWIIRSRALALLWFQRKFVLPNSAIHCVHGPHNLSDTTTIVDSKQYSFAFSYLWFLSLITDIGTSERKLS